MALVCLIGSSPNWTRAETDPPAKGAGLADVVDYYPLARSHLETIRANKAKLDSTYRFASIGWTAERDSLNVSLDIQGRQLEIALANQAKWYQDIRLWFIIGAMAGILTVSQTLKIVF